MLNMASQNSEAVKRLLDSLQSDLKNLSLETKRKHPSVKESAEEAIVKIRNPGLSSSNTPLAYLSNQILYPLVQVGNQVVLREKCLKHSFSSGLRDERQQNSKFMPPSDPETDNSSGA